MTVETILSAFLYDKMSLNCFFLHVEMQVYLDRYFKWVSNLDISIIPARFLSVLSVRFVKKTCVQLPYSQQ